MAQTLEIRRTGAPVKVRSPWAAALLPYVTLGIYDIVWWYRINRELRDYGDAGGHDLGRSPTKSALAAFPGCFLVVPALITYYRGTKRIQAAARVAGIEPVNGWIALIMFLVLPAVLWAYLQASLNSIWRAEATDPTGGAAPSRRLPSRHEENPRRRRPEVRRVGGVTPVDLPQASAGLADVGDVDPPLLPEGRRVQVSVDVSGRILLRLPAHVENAA